MRFPPYSYVPGGPWPHPKSHPDGHSYHTDEGPALAMVPERWQESEVYVEGVRLFNAGYYWEAHEAWERLWHAAGRSGTTAAFLKALIKLAAAGVKLREGVPAGASTHAGRAEAIFRNLIETVGPRFAGQDLPTLAEHANLTKKNRAIISNYTKSDPIVVMFEWKLECF